MLATFDVLSEGRLTIGAGVGWMEEEFEALVRPVCGARRGDRRILPPVQSALDRGEAPFYGKYVQMSEVGFLPKRCQAPSPIWIGGHTRPALGARPSSAMAGLPSAFARRRSWNPRRWRQRLASCGRSPARQAAPRERSPSPSPRRSRLLRRRAAPALSERECRRDCRRLSAVPGARGDQLQHQLPRHEHQRARGGDGAFRARGHAADPSGLAERRRALARRKRCRRKSARKSL